MRKEVKQEIHQGNPFAAAGAGENAHHDTTPGLCGGNNTSGRGSQQKPDGFGAHGITAPVRQKNEIRDKREDV